MEEIAEVGEKDRRVVWIEDRDARLDAVKPGTGGKLAFQAVGVAIDVEGSFAGRRLVAKIADEDRPVVKTARSEEHTSELQSLMRRSYAVFCLKKKKPKQ